MAGKKMNVSPADQEIEIWKMKQLIKSLTNTKGNGTSMISLIINPRDQISRINKMMTDELGMASNIKSRVNRLSVLAAIVSVQQKLKLYNKVPKNGLIIYCGNVITDEGKEKKLSIDFEPFRPINTSLYMCDNKFHTEALQDLFDNDQKTGFIVADGRGAFFSIMHGNVKEVLFKYDVNLPSKHGRGGQSASRYARIRLEKRHNYMRKIAETAKKIFLDSEHTISWLVLAGAAEIKTELSQSELFDPRLRAKILDVVDVAYGGQIGFKHAVKSISGKLRSVKYVQEKKLIVKYFTEISLEAGKYCFGVNNTLEALEQGAVGTLICWENLDIQRYVLKSHSKNIEINLYLTPKQEKDKSRFKDKENGEEYEFVEKQSLLEWLANNYKSFGTKLVLVSDKSAEGKQFVHGFGGIGGLLRYAVHLEMEEDPDDGEVFYMDEY